MYRRTHLRRESKISCGSFLIADDDPQLIDDLSLTFTLQNRADEPMHNHPRRFGWEEFRDSGDAVANHILQQFSSKPAKPMSLVSKQRPCVWVISQFVTIISL